MGGFLWLLWGKGLPPPEWDESFDSGEWLLNRFPPKSALARDPIDGDLSRPLEGITHGWYSRTLINRELNNYVAPGTLILAHMANVTHRQYLGLVGHVNCGRKQHFFELLSHQDMCEETPMNYIQQWQTSSRISKQHTS